MKTKELNETSDDEILEWFAKDFEGGGIKPPNWQAYIRRALQILARRELARSK